MTYSSKYKKSIRYRMAIAVFVSAISFGFCTSSHAGIFDDIGDAIGGVVDKITEIFSSAANVADSVVDKIDKNVIANVSGRCSVVEVEKDSGESETRNVVEECGHGVRELRDVFADIGGELVEQGREVDNSLQEIAKDSWDDISGPYANAAKDVVLFYGDAAIEPLKNLTTDLLDAMKDVGKTLAEFNLLSEDLSSGTMINVYYTKNIAKATLDFIVQGVVNNKITDSGMDFVSLDGKLIVKLKTKSSVGYNPEAYAQLEYVNPLIKIDNGQIKGLFVLQPEGAIKLSSAVAPLRFSAGLNKLLDLIPALKNVAILRNNSKIISFDVEVGTVGLSVPLTNQKDSRFNFDLEVSAAVDAAAKITSAWRVKIVERVKWKRKITLNVPAIQLPLGSVPAGVIGALESDSGEPSYAEQIAAYTFNGSNSDLILDTSGYGNHARLIGGVTLKDGAAHFDGKDGYIDLPDDLMASMDGITVYSEVLINDAQETPYFIYGLGNSKGELGDGYLFTTGDRYRSVMSTCHWICEQSTLDNDINVPRGSWQKLVYTVKNNVATLYLNGDIVAKNTEITLKPSDIGNGKTSANYIGRSVYLNDKYLNGAVRNFQIWDGALTHKEIIDKFGDGPSKNTFVVRAQGTSGSEKLRLEIGGQTIKTWSISNKMADYSVTSIANGEIRVAFINDETGRDVKVDYIKVNDKVRQAEDQDDNTGVWANDSCGGGTKSEWLHCNGSIGFGNVTLN